MKQLIPHKNILDAAFITPNNKVLSDDNQHLISAIGNRGGTPEPKRCYDIDGVDDELQLVIASVGTLYVSAMLLDGTLDTDIAIAYVTDRYKITKTVAGKVFNIKVWTANTATDAQKKDYTTLPTHSWLKSDEGDGIIAYDSSGNANDWTITNAILSTFHYGGADVPYSFQNEAGFTNYHVDLSGTSNIHGDQNGVSFYVTSIKGGLKCTGLTSSTSRLVWSIDVDKGYYINFIINIDRYTSGSISCGILERTTTTTTTTVTLLNLGSFNSLGEHAIEIYVPYDAQALAVLSPFVEVSSGADLDFYAVECNAIGVIARDESNIPKNIHGNELSNKGKIKHLAKIKNVNVGVFDGVDDKLTFDSGGDTITIVQSIGTATPTVVGSTIEWTAGNCLYLKLSDGTNVSEYYFNEGAGDIVFDITGHGMHLTFTGHTDPTQWGKSDDVIDYRLVNGYNKNIVKYESDFSIAGNDGWTERYSELTGNIDAILSVDDVLKWDAIGIASAHIIYRTILTIGRRYTIQFDYYILAANVNADQIYVRHSPNYWGGDDISIETTVGSWVTTDVHEFTATGVLLTLTMWDSVDGKNFNGADIDDIIYLKNIKIIDVTPLPADLSNPTKDIDGNELTYRGIEVEKKLPNDLGIDIDFTEYKALPDGLPNDYQVGDVLTNDMLVDNDDTDKNKKLLIGKEAINANTRLKTYTRTV